MIVTIFISYDQLCGVKEIRPVGSDSDEDFGRLA